MDIVKASALALEIEKKINGGLADTKKPWLFYQAQLELDDLLAMISAASATISKTSAPPGIGGATPPGRGGPPPPSGPGPKVMSSGGLGAASGKSSAVTKGTTSAPPPPPGAGGLKPPGGSVTSGIGATPPPAGKGGSAAVDASLSLDTKKLNNILSDVSKLKLLISANDKTNSKTAVESIISDLAKTLPKQATIKSPLFNTQMYIFSAAHKIEQNYNNAIATAEHILTADQKTLKTSKKGNRYEQVANAYKNYTEVLKEDVKGKLDRKSSPNFEVQREDIINNLSITSGPKGKQSFLYNYLSDESFRKEIDKLNDGKPVINNKEFQQVFTGIGKIKGLAQLIKDRKAIEDGLITPKDAAEKQFDIEVKDLKNNLLNKIKTEKVPTLMKSEFKLNPEEAISADHDQKSALIFIDEKIDEVGDKSHPDIKALQKIFENQKIAAQSGAAALSTFNTKIDSLLSSSISATNLKEWQDEIKDVLFIREQSLLKIINFENEVNDQKAHAKKVTDQLISNGQINISVIFSHKEGLDLAKSALTNMINGLSFQKPKAGAKASATSGAATTLPQSVQDLQDAKFSFKWSKDDKGDVATVDFFDLSNFDSDTTEGMKSAIIRRNFKILLKDKNSAPSDEEMVSKLESLVAEPKGASITTPIPHIFLVGLASGYITLKPNQKFTMLARDINDSTFKINASKLKNFDAMINEIYTQMGKKPPSGTTVSNDLAMLLKDSNNKIAVKNLGISPSKPIINQAATSAAIAAEAAAKAKKAKKEAAAAKAGGAPLTKPVKATTPSGLSKPPTSSISSAGGAPISGVPSSPPIVPPVAAVTFSAGASATPIKSLSGPGAALSTVPVDKKKLKELEVEIKDNKNKLISIDKDILLMETFKKFAVSEFNARGGETALLKLKKDKTTIEASIAKASAEISAMTGITGGVEIDSSSLAKVGAVLTALKSGGTVSKADEIEALEAGSIAITTIIESNEVKALAQECIDNISKKKVIVLHALQDLATKCNTGNWKDVQKEVIALSMLKENGMNMGTQLSIKNTFSRIEPSGPKSTVKPSGIP